MCVELDGKISMRYMEISRKCLQVICVNKLNGIKIQHSPIRLSSLSLISWVINNDYFLYLKLSVTVIV